MITFTPEEIWPSDKPPLTGFLFEKNPRFESHGDPNVTPVGVGVWRAPHPRKTSDEIVRRSVFVRSNRSKIGLRK